MNRIKDSIGYPKMIAFVVGIWLVVFVLIPSYISPKSEIPSEGGIEEYRQEQARLERRCDEWRKVYTSIPNLSADYILSKGEKRILELGPNELSRKITAKGAAKFDSSSEVVVLLPDGESVTHHPTDKIDLKGYITLQFVFENEEGGCILFSN